MVLDPGVSSIRDESGTYQKLPVKKNFQKASFQNGESFAEFAFPANTFGPWGNRCQVVTAGIPPGETRTFAVSVGKLSSGEMEKIRSTISNTPAAPEIKNVSSGPAEKIKIGGRYINDVPKYWSADMAQVDALNAIFYEGPDYRGKPSKVFAYYGVPSVKSGEKVPAIVLVHGGVGTAYSDWVKLWVSRGYAAIAMDLCGSLPIRDTDGKKWKKIADGGGPAGWEVSFGQINEPLPDQWPCYAVNAIARARTLIGSFPEVDNSRVGITGISWGGFLTCIVAGVDSRYLFAVPVYGCGSLQNNSAWSERLKPPGMDKWCRQFDPLEYLPDAKMPLLWVAGTNDNFYPLVSLQKSYSLVKAPVTLCIKPRMVHSHGGPGEKPEEIRAFADSFCKGGQQLATVTGQGAEKDGTAWVQWKSPVKIDKAEFLYTKASGIWKERKWESSAAQINQDAGKASFKIPEGATVYYFNITDSRGLVSSSRHVEREK
jgi:dienelactone hydrolase